MYARSCVCLPFGLLLSRVVDRSVGRLIGMLVGWLLWLASLVGRIPDLVCRGRASACFCVFLAWSALDSCLHESSAMGVWRRQCQVWSVWYVHMWPMALVGGYRRPGYAFVNFHCADSAAACISACSGLPFGDSEEQRPLRLASVVFRSFRFRWELRHSQSCDLSHHRVHFVHACAQLSPLGSVGRK